MVYTTWHMKKNVGSPLNFPVFGVALLGVLIIFAVLAIVAGVIVLAVNP